MSLENDINQKKFRNEYQKVIINLIYTHNWLMERMKSMFENEDLTLQQYNILRILRGSETPLSTLQIRQRMLDKMSDTSRIVDRLITKGLVKKSSCKEDKRLVDIMITTKGRRLLEKMDLLNDEMDNLVAALSTEEAKQLNALLDGIRVPQQN
ncbi:MAG TPA: MarR family transcriptional regulator [Parasegetibacter sp.]